jgi:hypothetical protein
MKTVDMDNIETLIEEFRYATTLVVEKTERTNPDELYCAFISGDGKYDIQYHPDTLQYLRAFGASFKEAIKNLNTLCA